MNEVILVADDEKEIADLVALYLENEGYQVFSLILRQMSRPLAPGIIMSRITTSNWPFPR